MDMLNGIGPDAKAYLKNYWEGVAVVPLRFSGSSAQVLQFLESNPYPVLNIISAEGNLFEVHVE